MMAQITHHVASLGGHWPEDQATLFAGIPLVDEDTLDQCRVEALTTLLHACG
jgi:hypothetical protein